MFEVPKKSNFKPFPIERVPHVHDGVAATRGKSPMHGVEGNRVHWVDQLTDLILHPVAFECVL